MRAVKKHASQRWMVLYIERWLKAPVEQENGHLVPRQKGTPQGGVASPLLANLFLHYAFDRWIVATCYSECSGREGTPMMSSSAVERNGRLRRFGRQLRSGCWTVDWNSIRRRRRSSIARMICGREGTPDEKLRFSWVRIPSRGSRSIAKEKSLPISVPRSRPKLPSRCGQSSAIVRNWRLRQCGCIESLGRSFPPLQYSDSPGLVPILRQVLPYRALPGDPPTGSRAGQLGQTEIQETA